MRKITLLLFTIFLLGQTACKKDKKEEIIVPVLPTVVKIVPGLYHTFLLKSDHSLYATGYNTNHQIDLYTGLFESDQDTIIKVLDNVLDVSAGFTGSFVLKTDNTLWATPFNSGTKGLPPIGFQKLADDVVKVSAIRFHALILKKDGTAWAIGNNNYGQFGIGTTDDSETFIQIASNVKDIVAGYGSSFIIKSDNTLWAAGDNTYGLLGDKTIVDRKTFVQVNTDVSQVACGEYHTLILKKGTAYGIGDNRLHQLGKILLVSKEWKNLKANISSIQAGAYSSFLIAKNTTFIAGTNMNGQFAGINGLDFDDVKDEFGDIPYFNFDKIFVGPFNLFILTSKGFIYGSGINDYGQLGIGDIEDKNNLVFLKGYADPDAM